MRKTASLPTHVATPPLWNGVLPGQATPNSPLAGQAPDDSQYPAARAAAAPAGRSADGEPTPDGSYGNAGSYRAANRNDREPELNYRSESNYRTAERTPAGPPTTYGPGSIAPQSARPPYEPRRAAPANDSRQPATPYFWPPTAPNQAPMPAPQARTSARCQPRQPRMHH
ncbi:MAG: hypothetical protein K8T25_00695 [Planctomycetia bacterium]|nr:hypothetical protein [Planctomycetia bacterium]